MFDRVLIANRGEIACRVIRTCRRLGVGTVAVYSSADRHALHVEMADEAVRIGAAPSSESYLNASRILEAARETGAQAVHPGYGFLSENAAFAAACAEAGIVFVGPSPAAIRAMGDKAEAKRLMAAAGVPVLPGDPGAAQDDASLAAAARAAGYPVIVKPAAGGGGRGMRIVRAEVDLADSLAAARREAMASFGDDALMIERYLENPRHIEVQIFGDGAGNVVHLFERDCSAQRRHQKVIEEAPAPGLNGELRMALHEAACAAARAVGYVGAGTVEFLVGPDGGHWFMEMNTRLQVEHPATEMITGLDLVEWQLRVAAGETLPLRQNEIRCCGHAIEARLYAEDPAAGFTPGTGRLACLDLPEGEGLRVDTGVRSGDGITVHYDPMIAKIVAHGPDRAAACERLSAALAAVRVAGPATNEAFLKAIVDHPAFRAGGIDTGFIAEHLEALAPPPVVAPDGIVVMAAFAELTRPAAGDRSPWADTRGWRLGGASGRRVNILSGESRNSFVLRNGNRLLRNGKPVAVTAKWLSRDRLETTSGSRKLVGAVFRDGTRLTLFVGGVRHVLDMDDPLARHGGGGADAGSLIARMPGVVVAVPVEVGDRVAAGAPLIVVEAMKVEHTLRAPADGTVTALPFGVGDRVSEGVDLVGFEPEQTRTETRSER